MSRATDSATRKQNAASRPDIAAWVSAHAGSGKTHLLVNRVIRLMLEGAEPEKILCLTYTRAAAAEMKNRLFERLSKWISLDDRALREAIFRDTGHECLYEKGFSLNRPRQLFARALETPGGLKVQTIHAFCERLLKSFPVEAGLSPGFEVLDEPRGSELLAAARARVLAGETAFGGERLKESLALLSALLSENGFDELLEKLLAHRDLLRRLAGAGERAAHEARLATLLAVSPGVEPEEHMREWFAALNRRALREAAQILPQSYPGATNNAQAELFAALAEAKSPDGAWELGAKAFLTKDNAPKADNSVMTKKAREAEPVLAKAILDIRDSFLQARESWLAQNTLRANMALLDAGTAIVAEYEAAKARGGWCDYDDLVARALALLSDENHHSGWVLYRLDGGVDHILVDEAQDTSPAQWRIIRKLAEEFWAGETAHDGRPRTVFAVGDFKQSIYSFQGADPESFEEMREFFEARFGESRTDFLFVEMRTSFRTVPEILKAVDMALARAPVSDRPMSIPAHLPARSADHGLVELWPAQTAEGGKRGKDGKAAEALWRPPAGLEFPDQPKRALARRIARTISALVRDGVLVHDKPDPDTGQPRLRPIRYGDILILLRKRTTFMDALISALKQAGIPVAGADRLKVGAHLAVRDMMALGRFMLNREDDLSLACVLKSPLLARDDGEPFDDDDLLALRHGHGGPGVSLWRQLTAAARAGQPFDEAVNRLRQWWSRAAFTEPYEFYAGVLGRDGGKRAFLARLGEEAAEPLEAFLDMLRAFERDHAASLTGFLEFMEKSRPELKRDMEETTAQVRVMTIHGAKGLEAPVVFLPDTCDAPARGRTQIAVIPDAEGAGRDGGTPLWVMRKDMRCEPAKRVMDRLHERRMREYNRLLYVAMTRARDRLYIGGALKKGGEKPGKDSWYAHLHELFARDEYAVRGADGEPLCWRLGEPGPAGRAGAQAGGAAVRPEDWMLRRPPVEPGAARWLAPSHMGRPAAGEEALSPLAAEARQNRFARGLMIHKLLQFLPQIRDAAARREAALNWLAAPPRGLSHEAARELYDEVAAILDDPRFSALFGPMSRAEAPFAARVEGPDGAPLLVSGQIDRLVVTDSEIIVADYKTARPAPASLKDVPEEYIRQLAVYRAAMRALWPGRPVRAVLVWTAAPSVMEIPQELLDKAG